MLARELLVTFVADLAPERVATVTITRRCSTCGADGHGRPIVIGADVAVSVAYAGAAVAVAVAPAAEAAAIGVDLERVPAVGRHVPLAELGPLFAPRAAPSVEGWTLLEAALKADGRGLRVELADCIIERAPAGASRADENGATEYAISIPERDRPIEAAVLRGPEGFVLSAALIPL